MIWYDINHYDNFTIFYPQYQIHVDTEGWYSLLQASTRNCKRTHIRWNLHVKSFLKLTSMIHWSSCILKPISKYGGLSCDFWFNESLIFGYHWWLYSQMHAHKNKTSCSWNFQFDFINTNCYTNHKKILSYNWMIRQDI